MATLNGGAANHHPGLALHSLPFVDMTTLSQSELRALSLTSPSSSELRRPGDGNVVTPTVDRSSFNESAGSRRQTYSRPSPHHLHHRHRLAALLPKTPNLPNPSPPSTAAADPDRIDSHVIITFLKHLLATHPSFQPPDYVDFDILTRFNNAVRFTPEAPEPEFPVKGEGFGKRKRGRKPRGKLEIADVKERMAGMEIVNKHGVAVDVAGLGALEDPYRDELRRRTEGMEKEEELLGFFRGLGGQWCSRRRKRKIVDASEFGDALPVGWKLLLGLKRKEGRAWVYCRRYISPGGQQFISCKDVSAYLQTFFGPNAIQEAMDHAEQDHRVISGSYADAMEKQEELGQSNGLQTEMTLLGIENLAEVQIRDLFECHKCKMTFDEKDAYLQHLLSFHQRTTRRYRLGSSVGDGVILKDGKYECQFCHKLFQERHRYNGHVGIHVRNYVRGVEEVPGGQTNLQKQSASPTINELSTRISKMDALIEIAQNSIRETSSQHNDELNTDFSSDRQNLVSNPEFPFSVSDHEPDYDSPFSEPEMEVGMIDNSLEMDVFQQKDDYMITDKNVEKINDVSEVVNVEVGFSTSNPHYGSASELFHCKDGVGFSHDGIEKCGCEQERCPERHSRAPSGNQENCKVENNMDFIVTEGSYQPKFEEGTMKDIEVENAFGANNTVAENVVVQEAVQQHSLQHGVSENNASLLQGENLFGAVDQSHNIIDEFDEGRTEEMEQFKSSFGISQEAISLPVVAIDSANNTEMEGANGTSVQFESQVALGMAGGPLSTVCVWCGVEFSHEGVDTEMQSDSVGYMCQTCKAKVCEQINELNDGCP